MHRFMRRFLPIAFVALAVPMQSRAADPSEAVPSLKYVPADATFYSSSLKLGEQMDRFLQSKAFAKLRDMPAVQTAIKMAHQHMQDEHNPLHKFMEAMHEPDNRQAAEVVHDMWRHEIFTYGGKDWTDFLNLLSEINNANRFAPVTSALRGEKGENAQLHAITEVLTKHGDRLKIPQVVLGFRTTKADAAAAQIARLEKHLEERAKNTKFEGHIQQERVAGSQALAVHLDGSMIPWDRMDVNELGDNAADIKKIIERVKSMKATICLFVKDGFVLLTVGPDKSVAETFGRGGATLASRPEFQPLQKYTDKPLVAVGYLSQALANAVATKPEDIQELAEMAKGALAKTPLSAERQAAIEKDIKKLATEIGQSLPKPAASFSVEFTTPRGYEMFSYTYGADESRAGEKLKITEHLGGSPIVAVAGVAGDPAASYQTFKRWALVFYKHANESAKELMGDAHQQVEGGISMARPFLERFDKIIGTELLPAVGPGERAFVVDAKWTSREWFPGLDQGNTVLPMFELGAVRSVKNSAQVLKALEQLRALGTDILAKVREFGVPLPEGGVPAPEEKKVGDATVYYWPMPQFGQEHEIQPNLGLSHDYMVKSLSLKHTARLLMATPLSTLGGAIDGDKPLTLAVVFDFAGFMGTVQPWFDKFAMPHILENAPEQGQPGLTRQEIPDEVRTIFDVVKCFRGFRFAKYHEGNAAVLHGETVFEDLK